MRVRNQNKIDLLSFMCMGFLWCKGTKEEKADFLFEILIEPLSESAVEFKKVSALKEFDFEGMYDDDSFQHDEPILVWTSQQLNKAFHKLFLIAIDLPIDPAIKEDIQKLRVLNEDELKKSMLIWK